MQQKANLGTNDHQSRSDDSWLVGEEECLSLFPPHVLIHTFLRPLTGSCGKRECLLAHLACPLLSEDHFAYWQTIQFCNHFCSKLGFGTTWLRHIYKHLI